MTPAVKTVSISDVTTAYVDEGTGPAVLLVHGSGPGASAASNWAYTIPAVAGSRRVIALDLAGFGGSAAPDGADFAPPYWAAQAFALMDHLGIPQFSVVGNSLGGRIAMEMTLAHPERIERLILMGSGGLLQTPTPALATLRDFTPSREGMRDLIRTCFLFNPDLVTDELVEQRYQTTLATFGTYKRMFTGDRRASFMDPERIAQIETEALVVHGRDDLVIPPDNSIRISRLLRNADLVIFRNCGHWAQFERARDFNELLTDFLDRPPSKENA